jgi:DNA replication initiation complex subunit (GINS family)
MNGLSESTQSLKQLLDSEEQSEGLTRLPKDVYQRTASYILKLRKTADGNTGEPSNRLAKKQLWLLEGMGRELLILRLNKASDSGDTALLLPEEKCIYELRLEFERTRQKFTDAIAGGQPSVFTLLQKRQEEKKITVSFLKPLGEIVGFDLHRYGPFRVHDVAQLPAANAEVLVSNGDARRVFLGYPD